MYKGAAEKSLAEKVNDLIYPALNNQFFGGSTMCVELQTGGCRL
jgi:hypothetical protein